VANNPQFHHAQAIGRAVIRERVRTRLAKARAASAAGLDAKSAARRCGMSVSGMRNLLGRELGASVWPIEITEGA
jgi:hypothetical protein